MTQELPPIHLLLTEKNFTHGIGGLCVAIARLDPAEFDAQDAKDTIASFQGILEAATREATLHSILIKTDAPGFEGKICKTLKKLKKSSIDIYRKVAPLYKDFLIEDKRTDKIFRVNA